MNYFSKNSSKTQKSIWFICWRSVWASVNVCEIVVRVACHLAAISKGMSAVHVRTAPEAVGALAYCQTKSYHGASFWNPAYRIQLCDYRTHDPQSHQPLPSHQTRTTMVSKRWCEAMQPYWIKNCFPKLASGDEQLQHELEPNEIDVSSAKATMYKNRTQHLIH